MWLCINYVRADKPALRYVDAREFRIINHGWPDSGNVHTLSSYTRIPTYLKDSIRQELWDRGLNSAGIGIRFATNSKRIGIRYNLHSNFHMAHMADTGIKGTDLYIWVEEEGKRSSFLRSASDDRQSRARSRESDKLPLHLHSILCGPRQKAGMRQEKGP